jgi:hypothetical protein
VHRLQTISMTGDSHPVNRIICIPIKMEMSISVTRMAIMKISQTGRDKHNRVRVRTVSNCKVTDSNNWTSQLRTGARGPKIITALNSTTALVADHLVVADQAEEHPEAVVVVAAEGNQQVSSFTGDLTSVTPRLKLCLPENALAHGVYLNHPASI